MLRLPPGATLGVSDINDPQMTYESHSSFKQSRKTSWIIMVIMTGIQFCTDFLSPYCFRLYVRLTLSLLVPATMCDYEGCRAVFNMNECFR